MLVDLTSSGSGVLLDGNVARSASMLFSCIPTTHGHPQPSSQVQCLGFPLLLILIQTHRSCPNSASSGLRTSGLQGACLQWPPRPGSKKPGHEATAHPFKLKRQRSLHVALQLTTTEARELAWEKLRSVREYRRRVKLELRSRDLDCEKSASVCRSCRSSYAFSDFDSGRLGPALLCTA